MLTTRAMYSPHSGDHIVVNQLRDQVQIFAGAFRADERIAYDLLVMVMDPPANAGGTDKCPCKRAARALIRVCNKYWSPLRKLPIAGQ